MLGCFDLAARQQKAHGNMSATSLVDEKNADASFTQLVQLHEQRRRCGLATVSTTVGPLIVSRQLWQRWALTQGRPIVSVLGDSTEQWLTQWVHALTRRGQLNREADHYVAKRIGRDETQPLQLVEKTLREIEQLLERAQLSDYGMEPDRLCRWLLQRRAAGEELTAEALVSHQIRCIQNESGHISCAFAQLLSIVAESRRPALILQLDPLPGHSSNGNSSEAAFLAARRTIAKVVELATRVPELTVGLMVEADHWDAYLQRTPSNFAQAVIRSHVIQHSAGDIPVENRCQQSSRQRPAMRPVRRLTPNDTVVARTNLHQPPQPSTPDRPTRNVNSPAPGVLTSSDPPDLAFAPTEPNSREEPEPWKSEAERVLFELLEASSDLAGLFTLNLNLDFKFGPRAAEVDLACPALRIAIEIDGYFHFQEPENYRRDRRKDLVLQHHGFLVIRFLADDVVSQMRRVLETIRFAVRTRRAEISCSNA